MPHMTRCDLCKAPVTDGVPWSVYFGTPEPKARRLLCSACARRSGAVMTNGVWLAKEEKAG